MAHIERAKFLLRIKLQNTLGDLACHHAIACSYHMPVSCMGKFTGFNLSNQHVPWINHNVTLGLQLLLKTISKLFGCYQAFHGVIFGECTSLHQNIMS